MRFCSQHKRSGGCKKSIWAHPSIHTVDAVKNTGVIRKKIGDNLISHLDVGLHNGKSSWGTEWKQMQKWSIEDPHCQEHWDSSQQPDPEGFSGVVGVSPPQHHPAHFPASSPHFSISSSLSTADTPTSTIPVLHCVTAPSTVLQVTGNCDRFQQRRAQASLE